MLENTRVDASDPDVIAWRVFARYDFDRFDGVSVSAAATSSAEHDPLSAEKWAVFTARALQSAATPETTPCRASEAGFRFVLHLSALASEQRRSGKLDLARRWTDRIHTLGGLLVARYLDQAFAHLALGEAFSQYHKNAWQTHDRAAIERYLKLALDESLRAVALDPRNEIARFHVEAVSAGGSKTS